MAEDPSDEVDLQVVATAGSEPEADLISQRLADAGIPSVAHRTIGGPEFGSAGARYVYVQAGDLVRAREILGFPSPPP
jgi:hypothetical protein